MEPRIVERQRHSAGEARGELRMAAETGHREVAESLRPNHFVVARPFVDEQQRHAIDDERLANARDEPLAETIEIEVAVQIAREADERAAVVVLVAIERAVERILDGALHRAEQQHDHDRREHRDDHVVALRGVEKHDARQPQQRRVNREDGEDDGRVHEAALDDDLDVHQPVADERRRERQRHEAQRDDGELHRQRHPETERVRQRVSDRKRPGAERGAPDNPAKLPPRGRRSDVDPSRASAPPVRRS